MTNKIQDCIKLLCQTYRWTYEGNFMLEHPVAPANCGGGGGHRERRYEFSLEGSSDTISFTTRGVRARARVALAYQQGCKWATALHN